MRRVFLLLAVAGSMLAACGGDDGESSGTTTTTARETTTTAKASTTTVDRCAEATEESISAIGVLLDRVDSNFESLDEDAVGEVMRELGGNLGVGCGSSGAGDGLSEILVYLSEQSAVRSPVTSAYIEGMIGSLCDLELDLTTEARVVCTTN